MTGFLVDLTAPRERALIASDTLAYSVDGAEHLPLGFVSKVIPFAHHRGALIGSGLYDIQIRAAAELMLSSEIFGFERVVEALPDILRQATLDLARERGIADPNGLVLFCAGWVGLNEAEKRFEMVTFENKDDYRPQRGFAGLIGIPNIPASYIPPGFTAIASPEVRAMAGLRAIKRFVDDHGEALGMRATLGGEIMLSELRPDGISSRIVGRFDDMAATQDAIADAWADIANGVNLGGVGLVNRVADIPAAAANLQRLLDTGIAPTPGPAGMSRQQRRAAEKIARKAARRAA
jgi:hypothetical protein